MSDMDFKILWHFVVYVFTASQEIRKEIKAHSQPNVEKLIRKTIKRAKEEQDWSYREIFTKYCMDCWDKGP